MLIYAQDRHIRKRERFAGEPSFCHLSALIDLRDDDERATRLQNSENFAHILGQIGQKKWFPLPSRDRKHRPETATEKLSLA